MFLAIIATLQQNPVVTQSPQQIYVTVQQPPGPPEWVKILFTAAVGAIIGVLSSLLTETLKPYLTRVQEKRKIRQQIRLEVNSNIRAMESIAEVLKKLDLENDKYEADPLAAGDVSAAKLVYMKCVNHRWKISSVRYKRYVEDKEFWTFTVDKDEELERCYL